MYVCLYVCNVMLCCVMICFDMLCYVLFCFVLLCYVMLCMYVCMYACMYVFIYVFMYVYYGLTSPFCASICCSMFPRSLTTLTTTKTTFGAWTNLLRLMRTTFGSSRGRSRDWRPLRGASMESWWRPTGESKGKSKVTGKWMEIEKWSAQNCWLVDD